MLDVHPLSALDQLYRNIGHRVKVEMPKREAVLGVFIHSGAWERAFAPDHALHAVRKESTVCVRDHSPNVMAYQMNLLLDAQMFNKESV